MTYPLRPLGDVADVIMGQSPPGQTYNNDGVGTPLLNGPTEFGEFCPLATQFTTAASKRSIPGDLLFCVRGSTTGRMNWSNIEYALGRGVCAIRSADVASTRFVGYALTYRLDDLLQHAGGSTFPNLSRNDLLRFPVPWCAQAPSIAARLKLFDDLIENNTRRIAILEEMARRIFEEWFVHFRAPGCEGLPLIDSPLGPIPNGWEIRSLGNVVDLSGGEVRTGPFGSQLHQSDYCDEGVPVVMPADIATGRIDVARVARVPEWTRDRLEAHKLKLGDIVYGRRGDIGRKALVGQEQIGWLCGTGCIRVSIPSEAFAPIYLFHFLGREDVRKRIEGQAIGATMANLNTKIIRDVLTLVPPRHIQSKFSNVADNIDLLVRRLLEQNRNLRAQRDLLLPKLISGEIDLSEAAKLRDAAE